MPEVENAAERQKNLLVMTKRLQQRASVFPEAPLGAVPCAFPLLLLMHLVEASDSYKFSFKPPLIKRSCLKYPSLLPSIGER